MYGTWHGGMFGAFGFMGLFMMLGLAAIYIVFLVATWRIMKAFESFANSVKEIAENLKLRKEP